ncbi:multicopper oxidase family protein [Bacillus sp. KH172YL63]|uniref:multicopper oxidase family protein n=1 Tax=Bacillus sp. KH172YL63 TaxID=2709784 RepID=UPI0013E503D0|nr:multicopper oxidase [Bacillus sp. KH172YL63]BCB02680.1 spore coat protein A [Bacillus sp. KH172YL63]
MLEKFVDPLPIMETLSPTSIGRDGQYYEVTMTENMQKLHRDLPPTRIWGYNGRFPGPLFQVKRNQPVYVTWKNDLPERHLLPVDTTVHGAEKDKPEVRTVVHLHGGVTPDTSDGYPDAWFTKGFQEVGPFFNSETYVYPNQQRATTLWYHDHAIGITRLNIYAGLAGAYIIHDDEEDALQLPDEPYDIPLLIMDRSFNEDGSLYYPSQPDPPVPEIDPSFVPHFFGDTILVNGMVWPYLEVENRRYRFRLINGSNSRTYRFSLSNSASFIQIGSDQGLLSAPVPVREILLAPAERADVIIDFSSMEGKSITLENHARAPFPNGPAPDPDTTGSVMQFRVVKALSEKKNRDIPKVLSAVPRLPEHHATVTRTLLLNMRRDQYNREIHLLNDQKWSDPITEMPRLWSMEIWNLMNVTEESHPIHLHLVRFQILDRQRFDQDIYRREGRFVPVSPRKKPPQTEQGWKDTVCANPWEMTRIIVPFGPYTGLYVWHCHILEHEDEEMMRPYVVVR